MPLRNRLKVITFDATNTLLTFRVPPWNYYSITAQRYGYAVSGDELKDRMLKSFKYMWKNYPNYGRNSILWEEWWRYVVRQTFYGGIPCDTVELIANDLIRDFTTIKCWCKAPGADELVQQLRYDGYKLGIISNFDPRLDDILLNLKYYHYFDFIVNSYCVGYAKPDRRIFDKALAEAKMNNFVRSVQCLHIGDDVEKDYWGARDAGWHAIVLRKPFPPDKPPPAPEHVYNNLLHIRDAILENKIHI